MALLLLLAGLVFVGEFSADLALRVVRQASVLARLPGDWAEIVRIGTTAVVRLSGGVVARVARGPESLGDAEWEVQVAKALAQVGVPCVQPFPVEQPLIVDGHPVTFWVEIPGPLGRPSVAELGDVLRQLHAVTHLPGLDNLDPWARIQERIERAPISVQSRRSLGIVLGGLQQAWAKVEPGLVYDHVLHGDAHIGNLAKSAGGVTALVDLDAVCRGPREWDLVPTALYATSLGWLDRAQYQAFVQAYGWDVTTSPAYQVLARMRELRMTTWLALNAAESSEVADEVGHRIDCLLDPTLPRHWSAR